MQGFVNPYFADFLFYFPSVHGEARPTGEKSRRAGDVSASGAGVCRPQEDSGAVCAFPAERAAKSGAHRFRSHGAAATAVGDGTGCTVDPACSCRAALEDGYICPFRLAPIVKAKKQKIALAFQPYVWYNSPTFYWPVCWNWKTRRTQNLLRRFIPPWCKPLILQGFLKTEYVIWF